jgi:hypothetical protein
MRLRRRGYFRPRRHIGATRWPEVGPAFWAPLTEPQRSNGCDRHRVLGHHLVSTSRCPAPPRGAGWNQMLPTVPLPGNGPIRTVPTAGPEHFRTSDCSDVTSDRQPEMPASPASERTHGALLQSPTVPIHPIRPRRFTFSAKANQVNRCRIRVDHGRAGPPGSCTQRLCFYGLLALSPGTRSP